MNPPCTELEYNDFSLIFPGNKPLLRDGYARVFFLHVYSNFTARQGSKVLVPHRRGQPNNILLEYGQITAMIGGELRKCFLTLQSTFEHGFCGLEESILHH